MDTRGIHLCQPDGCKSCGACCGLYNYVDNSREALETRLRERTRLFERVRSGELTLDEYRAAIKYREDHRRIYKTIYACEFVGFLEPQELRVGCLLHPAGNGGRDLRDISFYGQEICDGHFCPSYEKLAAHEKEIMVALIDDWYLYGAVITDIDFVKSFFVHVQNRLGESVRPQRLLADEESCAALREYLQLKVSWPFRDQTRLRFGKYFFVGEEYDIDRIDYASLGVPVPAFDAIFLSLSSRFEGADEVVRAREIIEDKIERFCRGY